jgi:hypothetical protein
MLVCMIAVGTVLVLVVPEGRAKHVSMIAVGTVLVLEVPEGRGRRRTGAACL